MTKLASSQRMSRWDEGWGVLGVAFGFVFGQSSHQAQGCYGHEYDGVFSIVHGVRWCDEA